MLNWDKGSWRYQASVWRDWWTVMWSSDSRYEYSCGKLLQFTPMVLPFQWTYMLNWDRGSWRYQASVGQTDEQSCVLQYLCGKLLQSTPMILPFQWKYTLNWDRGSWRYQPSVGQTGGQACDLLTVNKSSSVASCLLVGISFLASP